MSVVAEKILQQFKALPCEEQREVREGISQIEARQKAWAEQQALLAICSRGIRAGGC